MIQHTTSDGSGLFGWLSRLRSYLILDPLIYLYTFVLGLVSLTASLIDPSGRFQHRCAWLWSWLILKTSASPLTVRGLDRIDTSKPYVYAVNHLSAMDIPVLYTGLPFPFRIIAKAELFRYPVLGWHLRRSGQIAVDRSNARASMRTLYQAVQSLQEGMPLVVFPEGGRSADGELQPFMSGAFYVAIKAQVPVVPMAVIGTYRMLPMNSFHIRPTELELRVGEPISSAGYTLRDMDHLADRVREAIQALVESRRAQASAQ